MNSELIVTNILNGFKPFLPYIISIFFIILLFIIVRSFFTCKKFSPSLFNDNNFHVVSLLNKQEIKVYEALLENIQIASNNQFKVFAQVSLGEILKNSDRSSFNRINQKRADFCIVDQNYLPIAIIEYHGGGHYRGNYKERDEIKQQAAEYAGLIYHAILERDFDDVGNHIKSTILPMLHAKKDKVSKKIYQKDHRIEPTF